MKMGLLVVMVGSRHMLLPCLWWRKEEEMQSITEADEKTVAE
jgi:hypothetical protein